MAISILCISPESLGQAIAAAQVTIRSQADPAAFERQPNQLLQGVTAPEDTVNVGDSG